MTQATGFIASVVVFDAKTHEIVKKLPIEKCGPYPGDDPRITKLGDVAFSPDGKYLAGGIGIITLWDTKTWQPAKDILGPFSRGSNAAGPVQSIAFSPDSQSLAIFYTSVFWPESKRVDGLEGAGILRRASLTDKSISSSGAIMAFNVETANRLFVVKAESGAMFTANLAYTANGQYLLSARREFRELKPGEHHKYYHCCLINDQ